MERKKALTKTEGLFGDDAPAEALETEAKLLDAPRPPPQKKDDDEEEEEYSV